MSEESAEERDADEGEESGDYGTKRTDTDAMGKDKRRQVGGGTYGPTVRKQLTLYGVAIALIVLVVIGSLTLVSGYDNRDMPLEPTAPWTEAGAELATPRDLDYIRNGPENTIPPPEIVNR